MSLPQGDLSRPATPQASAQAALHPSNSESVLLEQLDVASSRGERRGHTHSPGASSERARRSVASDSVRPRGLVHGFFIS